MSEDERRLWNEASKIKGGYTYEGACSSQLCFYLRDGGELRFCITDDDVGGDGKVHIDHYDGALPPGITGFAERT